MKKMFLVFFILVTFLNFAALAKPVGYRVAGRSKTIIQIARDVYKDQSKWPKIAKWNNIKAPYAIHTGQVLVLMDEPVVPVPEANLVQDVKSNENAVAAPAVLPLKKALAVERVKIDDENKAISPNDRKIIQDGADTIYIVNRRAPTLSLIGLELYGTRKMADLIAKWNGLPANANLILHQKLKLKTPPMMSATEGTQALIEVWTKVGNNKMVDRLSSLLSVEKEIIKAPAPVVKIEPEIEAGLAPKENLIKESAPQEAAPHEVVQNDSHLEKTLKLTDKVDEKAVLNQATVPVQSNVEVVGKVAEPVATTDQDPELAAVAATATASPPVTESAKVIIQPESIKSEPIVIQPVAQPVTQPTVQAVAPPVVQAATQPPVAEKKDVPVTSAEVEPERAPAAVIPFEEPTTDSYWLGGNAERIIKNLSNKNHSDKAK